MIVTVLVDNGRAKNVIYLDFCKTFDTVPHKTLASEMKRYGFDRQTVTWIRNWLDDHIQRVTVNSSISKWKPVTSSIPQGFRLRPILFIIFIINIVHNSTSTLLLSVKLVSMRKAALENMVPVIHSFSQVNPEMKGIFQELASSSKILLSLNSKICQLVILIALSPYASHYTTSNMLFSLVYMPQLSKLPLLKKINSTPTYAALSKRFLQMIRSLSLVISMPE
ncbi:hypothetical protein BTVI_04246 [Pitangus sulphuratus]|nr:hypothetical protein BTVI_04246 [Pitangus sulphuratus]